MCKSIFGKDPRPQADRSATQRPQGRLIAATGVQGKGNGQSRHLHYKVWWNVLPLDIEGFEIEPSKHFRNTKMRLWNWDVNDLRDAISQASKVVRRGKNKLEVRTRKDGSKKLIIAYFDDERLLLVMTGTEGQRA